VLVRGGLVAPYLRVIATTPVVRRSLEHFVETDRKLRAHGVVSHGGHSSSGGS
jgi:hypothetical protein